MSSLYSDAEPPVSFQKSIINANLNALLMLLFLAGTLPCPCPCYLRTYDNMINRRILRIICCDHSILLYVKSNGHGLIFNSRSHSIQEDVQPENHHFVPLGALRYSGRSSLSSVVLRQLCFRMGYKNEAPNVHVHFYQRLHSGCDYPEYGPGQHRANRRGRTHCIFLADNNVERSGYNNDISLYFTDLALLSRLWGIHFAYLAPACIFHGRDRSVLNPRA